MHRGLWMVAVVVMGDQACLISCCLLGFCWEAVTEKDTVFMKSGKLTRSQQQRTLGHWWKCCKTQAHRHKLEDSKHVATTLMRCVTSFFSPIDEKCAWQKSKYTSFRNVCRISLLWHQSRRCSSLGFWRYRYLGDIKIGRQGRPPLPPALECDTHIIHNHPAWTLPNSL